MAYKSSPLEVIFTDNSFCRMTPQALHLALLHDQVKKFRRSDGWAVVGISPLRGDKTPSTYIGPERRGRGAFYT